MGEGSTKRPGWWRQCRRGSFLQPPDRCAPAERNTAIRHSEPFRHAARAGGPVRWLAGRWDPGGVRALRGRLLRGVRRPGAALDDLQRAQPAGQVPVHAGRVPAQPLLPAVRQLRERRLAPGAVRRGAQHHHVPRRRRPRLQGEVPGDAGRLRRDRGRHEMVRAADELHGRHPGRAARAGFRDGLVSGADILGRLPRSDAGDPGIGPADLHRGGEGAAAAVQGGLHRAEPLHGDLRQGLPALPVQPRVVRRERLRLGDRGKGRRGQDRGRCFFDVPEAIELAIQYVNGRYKGTPVYITENGYSQWSDASREELIDDVRRKNYLQGYITYLSKAVRNGANVRGYFVWTLLDNFEWAFGYRLKYGLYHVDFDTQERTPRMSARWYQGFLTARTSQRDEAAQARRADS
uniref:Uncharacterized protein n=1 Tax=Zea mays TaxID=4577 RepID=A0A804RMV1_MAIZE